MTPSALERHGDALAAARSGAAPAAATRRTPLDFHSPYGCSKGVADQYVLDYARIFGLPTRRVPHELHLRAAPVRHRGPGLGRALPDPGARRASRSRSTATAARCATSSSSTTWSTPGCSAWSSIDRRRAAAPSTSAAGPATRSACASCWRRIERADRHRRRRSASADGGRATSAGTSPTRARSRRPPAGAPRSACDDGLGAARRAGWPATSSQRRRAPAEVPRMRVALVNPPWSFDGSIYFGCREPHLPLELRLGQGAARSGRATRSLLRRRAAVRPRRRATSRAEVRGVPARPHRRHDGAELPVLALRPARAARAAGAAASARRRRRRGSSPSARMARPRRARPCASSASTSSSWASARRWWRGSPAAPGTGSRASRIGDGDRDRVSTAARRRRASSTCRPLAWPRRVDRPPPSSPSPLRRRARSARAPRSRRRAAAPISCTFCAKENFRDRYRRRDAGAGDRRRSTRLIGAGRRVRLLHRRDLPAQPAAAARRWSARGLKFGVQTRIDLWKPEMLELLGRAGCVSIEAGVESLTREGRDALDKNCKLDDRRAGRPADRGQAARPVRPGQPDRDAAGRRRRWSTRWRDRLRDAGVWANDPVPLFPYPGSPDYRRLWGLPDDRAWERAVDH